MRGWLRYFTLNAQSRTGLSVAVLTWAFIAGVILGCAFALIALIGLVTCLIIRRRNMERARLELAARSSNWFDPKFLAVAAQIGQTIGWRRLAASAARASCASSFIRRTRSSTLSNVRSGLIHSRKATSIISP